MKVYITFSLEGVSGIVALSVVQNVRAKRFYIYFFIFSKLEP